jgi:hypothetical protein
MRRQVTSPRAKARDLKRLRASSRLLTANQAGFTVAGLIRPAVDQPFWEPEAQKQQTPPEAGLHIRQSRENS